MIFDVDRPPRLPSRAGVLGIVNKRLSKLPEKIIIKNGEVELEALISKFPISQLQGFYTYSMKYDGCDVDSFTGLKPFMIRFTDSPTGEINDNCYIGNFHKTHKYSGTQVICTILKFLKVLGVGIATLFDASSIGEQHVSLSLIKLIERGETFYSGFGFSPLFSHGLVHTFGTKQNMQKYLEAQRDITRIELQDVITYHQSLLAIMGTILHDHPQVDLRQNPVVGTKVISHYLLPDGMVREDRGISYSFLLMIVQASTNLLHLLFRIPETVKTLKDAVLFASKEKNVVLLEALLTFETLPISVTSHGKTLTADYLKPLAILAAMSSGTRTINLKKIDKIC